MGVSTATKRRGFGLPRAHLELDGEFAARHWPFLLVVCIACVPRLLIAVAYRPALFFSDSWSYVNLAYGPVHFAQDRPSGYPFVLHMLGLLGRSLTAITTVQHLAGLVTGILVYVLLIRVGTGRGIATGAAGLALLDAHAIVLEQTVTAEAFFTLALFASVYFLITGRRAGSLVAAGLLLAAAATMRTAGLFVVPVWLAYAAYRFRAGAALAVAVGALAIPLLGYSALYHQKTGHFGLSDSEGWFLYGRIGEIADCSKFSPPKGTRDLCVANASARKQPPVYYIWDPRSPANRRFGNIGAPGSSAALKHFSTAAIRAEPAAYAGIVWRDLVKYFEPGVASPGRSDTAIRLPSRSELSSRTLNPRVRDAYFPDYRPRVHAPAGVARMYASVVRAPRPLLAIALILSLALIPLRRRELPSAPERHGAEVFLLVGGAFAMAVGDTATSGFIVRYLIPTIPLFLAGGAIAATELIAVRRRPRERLYRAREPAT